MTELSNYVAKVVECGTKANEADTAERYEEALSWYLQALEIF
jgi:hypothetical protein